MIVSARPPASASAIEGSAGRSGPAFRRYVWIVDPIDGTRAYLAGSPDWCVLAALVESGRPVLGCLYAAATDEFMAVAGQGATRNGVSIAATGGASLADARITEPEEFSSTSSPASRRL